MCATFASLLLAGCDSSDKTAATPAPVEIPMSALALPLCLDGHCGVVDQNAKVLLSFDNPYNNILPNGFKDSVFLAGDEHWSLASADGKTVHKADLGDTLIDLTPGFYGFMREGKYGVIDRNGVEVQPPQYDDIYPSSPAQFIIFERDGLRGILDAQARPVTEALYSSSDVNIDPIRQGRLVMAERDEQPWLIDLDTHKQQTVDFGALKERGDEHLVVTSPDHSHEGLADAHGTLLIPTRYHWLGTPAAGRVAFRERYDAPCGYLDYQGKVVIPAQFANCEPFGKQGALAQEAKPDDSTGLYGFIDAQGQWKIPPTYDSADKAGLTAMGFTQAVPGYSVIGKNDGPFKRHYGLFSTDEGKELFAPTHALLGVIGQGLFAFSEDNSPQATINLMGQTSNAPAIGVMDRQGHTLIAPSQFIEASLDSSGRYLELIDGIDWQAHTALYDLKGQQVVAPKWMKLSIDPQRGYILAYSISGTAADQVEDLEALFDLQGKPRFTVQEVACGASQLQDANGKPVWPLDPQNHCPSSDATEDSDTQEPPSDG
ncbi:MAG: hypothetical protein GAK45_00494 [Pseudomonas citronellolis]|nr:MAG: hypothetical protein GAK45_00494 [Pseudomonas citronellolis]